MGKESLILFVSCLVLIHKLVLSEIMICLEFGKNTIFEKKTDSHE